MTDYVMNQIIKASNKLKAEKAAQKKATATTNAVKKELTQSEIDRYVQIIAKAAEGFVPAAEHKPNSSLLDSILIARLEALGLSPATAE